MAPLLYPPTEKDTSHWGRLPNSGRLLIKEAGTLAVMLCPPPPGSGATITPGGWVIRSWTRAICVPALHYHRLPELAAYSEEPQAIIELLINIIHNHQSHWDDCHQLMSALFTSDECRRAYQAARAGPVTQAPPQTANPERWADERIPDTRADWDPNTPTGLQSIQRMR
jgi:hypothetical protein